MNDLIYWHNCLLNDNVRMMSYRSAIHETVKPGDVVLDIGTGSGILSMFACQAGASHVYAVEIEDIILMARQLAKENGFADRITFLHKDVRTLQLKDKVDVIVSELISDNGPGENMADLVNWCRDRFLKPGGRIVPLQVDMVIAPIEDDKTYRITQVPDSTEYGINFSSFRNLSRNMTIRSYRREKLLLAPGHTAYSYHAPSSSSPDRFNASILFNVVQEGIFHGYCSWFKAKLTESIELSNKPPLDISWATIFFPIAEPAPVSPGTLIELIFHGIYDSSSNPICEWATTVQKGKQIVARHRQSSHLADIKKTIMVDT